MLNTVDVRVHLDENTGEYVIHLLIDDVPILATDPDGAVAIRDSFTDAINATEVHKATGSVVPAGKGN